MEIAAACKRWWIFTKERFPLATQVPALILFAAANMGGAFRAAQLPLSWTSLIIGSAAAVAFMFRLRCFDEIKDYETDIVENPDRPLPRGLLTIQEVKRVIALLAGFEILLVGLTFGAAPLGSYLIAVGYSFLMYREFFIGKYLRPLLTTYAVTHTFVSMLLGWALASAALEVSLFNLSGAALLFGAANWALFNIFEFARKTNASAEEVQGVDSYSSLFGPGGAALLTISQIAAAWFILWKLEPVFSYAGLLVVSAASAAVIAVAAVYAFRRTSSAAKAYRGAAQAFILAFYAAASLGAIFK